MYDIQSLPSSVRERLEDASSLASANRYQDADQLIAAAANTLATQHPELAAMVVSWAAGKSGIEMRVIESRSSIAEHRHKVLGVTMSRDINTTSETRTTTRRMSFF